MSVAKPSGVICLLTAVLVMTVTSSLVMHQGTVTQTLLWQPNGTTVLEMISMLLLVSLQMVAWYDILCLVHLYTKKNS